MTINGRNEKRYQQMPQQKVSRKRGMYFSYKSILALRVYESVADQR